MLLEQGLVVKKSDSQIWVQTASKTSCSSCQVNSTCGTGLVNKAFGEKSFITPLKNTLNANINDQVELGIDENLVVKASFLVYLLPLLSMMLGMLGWSWFKPQASELSLIVVALLSLGLGFIMVYRITTRFSHKKVNKSNSLEPVLLRIVSRPIAVKQVETS